MSVNAHQKWLFRFAFLIFKGLGKFSYYESGIIFVLRKLNLIKSVPEFDEPSSK